MYEMMHEDDNLSFSFLSPTAAIGAVGMPVGTLLCRHHPCHLHLYQRMHLLLVSVSVCGAVSNVRLCVLIPWGRLVARITFAHIQ